jgi:hypothetical protein
MEGGGWSGEQPTDVWGGCALAQPVVGCTQWQSATGQRPTGGSTLAGTAAREDVRPVQRTLAPRPHGLFNIWIHVLVSPRMCCRALISRPIDSLDSRFCRS